MTCKQVAFRIIMGTNAAHLDSHIFGGESEFIATGHLYYYC